MNLRERFRRRSNNADNPNKNVCVLAIAEALGCGDQTRYLHNYKDLVYALRQRYTVRSRGAKTKGKTIGKIRHLLPDMAAEVNAVGFVARVNGHVLLIDPSGKTVVDTAPRQRDRRKITAFYVVYDGPKDLPEPEAAPEPEAEPEAVKTPCMRIMLTQAEPRLFEVQAVTRNGALDTAVLNDIGSAEATVRNMVERYGIKEIQRDLLDGTRSKEIIE